MSTATSVTASCGVGGTVGICRVSHTYYVFGSQGTAEIATCEHYLQHSRPRRTSVVRSTYGPKLLQTPVNVSLLSGGAKTIMNLLVKLDSTSYIAVASRTAPADLSKVACTVGIVSTGRNART